MTALPPGEVLIRVLYSSLNYKDGLSATGNRGVTRRYPHVPGVDASGIVERCETSNFNPGDEVIVTGYDLGSNTDGGWSELIRVPAAWVVKCPAGLALRQAMQYGTAGFTAALSVHKLLKHGVRQEQGPILVTGATGGVGSIAAGLLAKLGFHVVAVSGKKDAGEFLNNLGVREIIGREEAIDATTKPLLSGKWAGVVDTVGGKLLETAVRQTKLDGAIACCGNIGSAEFHSSIYPFILRGVALIGIGSAFTSMELRVQLWKNLAAEWKLDSLGSITAETTLSELNEVYIDRILRGSVRGRVVVSLQSA
jgi:putative YhdH/YhfP family quinone oxidoreductase